MIVNKRILTVLFALCLPCVAVGLRAQSDDFGIWTDIEVKKKLFPGFDASAEGEFRTRNGLKNVERWSAGFGMAYRPVSFLKADGGYTYIYSRQPVEETKKGNLISAYWSPRHRFYASLTGSYTWYRLELSLRERYQWTRRMALSVPKYDGDDGSRKADEEISAKTKNILRTRLQAVWNIRKSAFSPYASCELYHSITDGWGIDKTRWTLGTGYRINKCHSVDAFYRYQNHADDDEANGHVLGVGYKLKL
ncbi:DUF2490 domain-containing protein [Bacteroides helcogenes]|uniref:DUF2490 domain-containing protein n=1 Tax=Bacteroides helcogenes (strain ATCC 35417 / DSM 20613 / JCM 6297 / CCUG 15421 / P 36-108) TaxID=693979 RepID=E6SQZ1_BACT6|nr:DUF2490 domain-containing protein [Bacteroides helcogenes]ADV45060.1 Protein of unknown function DUF2490 [Bacteroides helcogenes P 36-108]MDY5239918.1 DUF2490 domain-containing protein [Bacteroides helcogenes]